MSRTKTFIIHCMDNPKDIPDHDDNTMSFASVIDQTVFTKLYKHIGSRFTGIAAADDHATNVAKVMREAFRQRIHYFKAMMNVGQIAYLRRDRPFVVLPEYSWGVDMNLMKNKIRKATGQRELEVSDADLWFDDNYNTMVGILYDVSRIIDVKPQIELPEMEEEDLSVYIARWNGPPGFEKHTVPYNL